MKNDEFNKMSSNELNSSNSFEFGPNATNDSIVNNSDGVINNYDNNTNEFGDDSLSNNLNSNTDSLNINDLNEQIANASTSGAGAGAASAATISASAAASIATTALVAIVGGLTLMTTTVTTEVQIEIESIIASYNYIDYSIKAIGNTDSLELKITNDFVSYVVPLEEGINIGQATDLKPNMDYTITITYDDFLAKTTAYKGVITTLSTKEYITDINTFDLIYNCQCGVDGYFYFYMDFRDDYKYWFNFEATLEDNYGNISACVFTDDLYDLQRIAIVNYDGKYNDLIGEEARLKISCDSKENNEKIVLYDETVEI